VIWLGGCEDAFESAESELAEGKELKEVDKIREAGMQMKGVGQQWWSQRRTVLKALPTWERFEAEVRSRFLSAGLTLSGMHTFHLLEQSGEFSTFASELVAARNIVGLDSNSQPLIVDETFKNHLLHRSHPILYARVTSTPTFTLTSFSVDQLTQHMSAVWAGLRLEGALRRRPTSLTTSTTSTATTSTPSRRAPLPPLTAAGRDKLSKIGACFKCRVPGHISRDCPKVDNLTSSTTPEPVVKAETGLRAFNMRMMEEYNAERDEGFPLELPSSESEGESDFYG